MTRKEVLTQLANGEITIEQAQELLGSNSEPRDSVSVLSNGRLRLQNGTQLDVTVAQILLVRKQQEKIDETLLEKLSGRVVKETKTKAYKDKDGSAKERSWDEYRMGGVLLGYKQSQVDAVLAEFGIEEEKPATGKDSAIAKATTKAA